MVQSFTDFDVFGWFGIFLLPYDIRKQQLGSRRKRLRLILQEKPDFSQEYAKYLAALGLAPCLTKRGGLSSRQVYACWRCEAAFTDISEGDDVAVLHKQVSPRCKSQSSAGTRTSVWRRLLCCCR